MNRKQRLAGLAGLATALCSAAGIAQETESVVPEAGLHVARQAITESALHGHIRFLADDALEGRGPGSRGDQIAQLYVAAAFQRAGLKPLGEDGTWFQSVPLVGVRTTAPASLELAAPNNQTVRLRRHDDYIFNSGMPQASVAIDAAELVFVGYGIVAPEYDWNDYKDVDLRGKVLVMMNNDPADDPDLFAGNRRLYYGRWDYKYEMAARQGAVGAIIIHTTESAGYPYQVVQTSWSGEEFELRGSERPRVKMTGWFTEDASRRVVQAAGRDLDTLRAQAQRRDFVPVPLGVRLSLDLSCEVREQDTRNVLGVLPGTDPQLAAQHVIYMAHHDHIGLAAERDATGDNVYNGAVDNASGVAALLALLDAYARLPERPRRSILFAAVGAEEQGLLGSEYFAAHPPIEPGRMAAVLNIDGVNILGPTHDINVIGFGKSSLDDIVQRVALAQRRIVTPDHFPDRGYYYRSDQFSLAKIGVPGVYLHSGIEVIGKPEGWGRAQLDDWVQSKYHQPSDEYDPTWDLSGAVLDQLLMFGVGYEVANQQSLPTWTPGDEFEAARRDALKAVKRVRRAE